LLGKGRKSSKCGGLLTGKIIPLVVQYGLGTDGTREPLQRFPRQWQLEERAMYIGLGGLLILILILWLLGVI
jgi:hypothetical protein